MDAFLISERAFHFIIHLHLKNPRRHSSKELDVLSSVLYNGVKEPFSIAQKIAI